MAAPSGVNIHALLNFYNRGKYVQRKRKEAPADHPLPTAKPLRTTESFLGHRNTTICFDLQQLDLNDNDKNPFPPTREFDLRRCFRIDQELDVEKSDTAQHHQQYLSPDVSETMIRTVLADPEGDVLLLFDPIIETGTDEIPSEAGLYKTHIKVSSKRMIEASPVFRAMLSDARFMEGTILSNTGRLVLPLVEDSSKFMALIVHFIHGNNTEAKPIDNMEDLLSFAMLVDKYRMVEAVSGYFKSCVEILHPKFDERSHGWHSSNKEGRATRLSWLCITRAFEMADEFSAAAWDCILNCPNNINIVDAFKEWRPSLEFPIPMSLIANLEINRQIEMETMWNALNDLLERLQSKECVCQQTCSAYTTTSAKNEFDSLGGGGPFGYRYPEKYHVRAIYSVKELLHSKRPLIKERSLSSQLLEIAVKLWFSRENLMPRLADPMWKVLDRLHRPLEKWDIKTLQRR